LNIIEDDTKDSDADDDDFTEEQSRAVKRASQLIQSDLLSQNSDGDSYVFIGVILV